MKKIIKKVLIGGTIGLGILMAISSTSYNNTTQRENDKFLNVNSTEEIEVLFDEEKSNRKKGYSAIHWLDATKEDIIKQSEKMAKLVVGEIAPEGINSVDFGTR
ncbi:MAG: hypothetical protein RSC84_03525 [Peptostreptococcaceae bacterium]